MTAKVLHRIDTHWSALYWWIVFLSSTILLAIVYPYVARSFVYFTANYYKDYWVEIESFHVDDIHLGEKIVFTSTRDVKVKSLPGSAIDEIDIIDADTYRTVYTSERPTVAERGSKTITKEIDYVHTETGNYEFRATVVSKLPYGVEMTRELTAQYRVLE